MNKEPGAPTPEDLSRQLKDIQNIICSLQEKIDLLPGIKEQINQLATTVGKLAQQPPSPATATTPAVTSTKPRTYSEALNQPAPAPESNNAPKIHLTKKTSPALTKAKKPLPKDERHIVLTHNDASPQVDPRDLILALNRQLHARERPQTYTQARYTKTGALSLYLDLHYPASQALATEAAQILKQIDPSIQDGSLFQKWGKIKVHTVELERYLEHPELLKEEIEFSLHAKLPLRPTWVKGFQALKENADGKRFSSVIVTLPSQQMAQKLASTGIFFSNRLHKVELFRETLTGSARKPAEHLPTQDPAKDTIQEAAKSSTQGSQDVAKSSSQGPQMNAESSTLGSQKNIKDSSKSSQKTTYAESTTQSSQKTTAAKSTTQRPQKTTDTKSTTQNSHKTSKSFSQRAMETLPLSSS